MTYNVFGGTLNLAQLTQLFQMQSVEHIANICAEFTRFHLSLFSTFYVVGVLLNLSMFCCYHVERFLSPKLSAFRHFSYRYGLTQFFGLSEKPTVMFSLKDRLAGLSAAEYLGERIMTRCGICFRVAWT